jgi:hypothetical protein
MIRPAAVHQRQASVDAFRRERLSTLITRNTTHDVGGA